ncbi:uncharacterized protein KD926_010512 [Aspergillus affinis]|uniref:uncharacterized protein n=1 Tax=Aspergillus affinis TaxID=1070780 RepID=UPI0022FEBCFA|nr:uncharacterized protein KD926_010512 [Aspergillus affinis]KAI9038672.1 hypothetical protein KD926_010512 [Aspergillus affinis]
MSAPSTSTSTSSMPEGPKKYNLRNPLPLSAAQESEVKQIYYKRVRALCAPEIKGSSTLPYPAPSSPILSYPTPTTHQQYMSLKPITQQDPANPSYLPYTAFAECAVNRTVTATWVCRTQRLAMNSCMVAHAKPEEEDRAREEWFSTHEERKRAKEDELAQVEKRREVVIRMMREDEERKRKGGN